MFVVDLKTSGSIKCSGVNVAHINGGMPVLGGISAPKETTCKASFPKSPLLGRH
jgi:hypothetical protein